MKTILSSRRHHRTKRVGIFLIAVALIAVMVGCEAAQYELTMAVNPEEGGTAIDVTSESPYTAGAKVNIKAEANPGYRFVKWTAPAGAFDDEDSTETTFTMPGQSVAVTANFVAVYELTMAADPEEGGEAIDVVGLGAYPLDAEVEIRAEANESWAFAGWTSAPEGIIDNEAEAETFLTMPAQNVTVTANFVAVYELTMATDPEEGGEAIDVAGLGAYPADAEVEIRAEANEGWAFTGWISAPEDIIDDEAEAETFLTMPAQNVTVTANFILFAGGNGTAEDPYQIADWRQLDNVRNYLNHHFIVINDLDSDTVGYEELASETANEGKGWQPIGTTAKGAKFAGSFDGQGYEICDLFIDRPDESEVGLFGVVDEVGVIENVDLVNGNVTGNDEVGGLVGKNEGTVSNSYSTSSVTGDTRVGGLVGQNSNAVSDSYSAGSVTGNDYVGGLVGRNEGTASNSYATVSVTGDDYVGGLVGRNEGTVSNSYSTGNVTGTSRVGGLVGYNEETVSNSFWDTETSGQANSSWGTGKTTEEMQDIATFSGAGWDIVTVANSSTRNTGYIWNIVDDVTYPFLSWQPI